MKKHFYFILFISLLISGLAGAQPTGYYNGTENKQGEELKGFQETSQIAVADSIDAARGSL